MILSRTVLGLTLFGALTVPAFAGPITWNLANVTASDGATFSGSFAFDADLLQYSSIHITATGGSFTPSSTWTQAIFPVFVDARRSLIVVDTEERSSPGTMYWHGTYRNPSRTLVAVPY